HARVAAAEDRRVGPLALRQRGEDLLPHGREPRAAADEARIAGSQPRKRLRSGQRLHADSNSCTTALARAVPPSASSASGASPRGRQQFESETRPPLPKTS